MGEVLKLDNLQTALADAVIGDSRATVKAERNQLNSTKRENANLLKSQLATYRAKMGGMGLSPSDGSAAAVIKRLEDENTEKNRELDRDFKQKIKRAKRSSLLKGAMTLLV
ncbi:MAG: hypothetical protein ILP11_00860 [Alphaproteobacteria bacterium]|nr:hypothetical protein [Alphaproteobacteria bacterium]